MEMTEFILNDQLIRTACPAGMPLLDYIRYEANLTGTKCGCREGDCGACTVMEGVLEQNRVVYHTIVSCLSPLGSVHGKHIVTIEGIGARRLHPAQQAVIGNSATQCGFCTPGIILSLVSAGLSCGDSGSNGARDAIAGNICRCTGYKSIEKAAEEFLSNPGSKEKENITELVDSGYLPDWFLSIPERLADIEKKKKGNSDGPLIIGGGTDLMVRQADNIYDAGLTFIRSEHKGKITSKNGICTAEASATVTGILQSAVFQSFLPDLQKYVRLISSEQIRNMGTIGGNLVNGSPIADLAIIFLALNASLIIEDREGNQRTIPLCSFYLGYKTLDLKEGEQVRQLFFAIPGHSERFHFEKVSKREHLDIASVNSAICIRMEGNNVAAMHLSAGGVAPVPKYLPETCHFLTGRSITAGVLREANDIMQSEIAPISDIRGSAQYKRLLLRQLFYSHFIELFPDMVNVDQLLIHPAHDEKP